STIKPTRALVSMRGIVPLAPSLDHAGTMARTLADCALLLAAIVGVARRVEPRSLAGVRLGVSARTGSLDEEVAAGLEAALDACRRLGAELVQAPAPRDTLPDWGYVFDAEIYEYHRRFDDLRHLYRPSTREFVERGARAERSRYDELQARREEDRAWWEDWLVRERVDAVLEPTVPDVAWPRGPGYDHAGSDVRLIALTHHWDWTGHPVAALPAGLGAQTGLPVGVSLIGPAGSDWELLALGVALQAELGVPGPPPLLQAAYDGGDDDRRGSAHDRLRDRGQAGLQARGRGGHRGRAARRVPVHTRAVSDDVPREAVDDPAIRRLRLRGGDERPLPLPARARSDGALDRVRPADAAGPRLGRPARGGRGRPDGSGDRLGRRHGAALRRHPARRGVDVDDDQRAGLAAPAALRARRRGAGSPRRPAARHGPERHPQGVHRPRELHLPAAAVDAADDRPLRLLRRAAAELEHDLDLRLPHPGGRLDRGPGDRLHARERPRLLPGRGRSGARAGRLRRAPLLLLQRAQRLLPGGGEVPRRPPAVGEAAPRAAGRDEPEGARASLPRPDRRLDAHRPAAREQHRARRDPGAVGRLRRRAVDPHQLVRRGPRAADRARGPHRPAHAAGAPPRGRHDPDRRPARGLLLRRGADAGAGGPSARARRPGRGARRRRRRDRAGLRAGRDRGGGLPLHGSGRVRRAGRRRRQPLHGGRRAADRAAPARPADRAPTARAHGPRARGAERESRSDGVGRGTPRGRIRGEPPSPDARGPARPLHGRRDLQRPPGRMGH